MLTVPQELDIAATNCLDQRCRFPKSACATVLDAHHAPNATLQRDQRLEHAAALEAVRSRYWSNKQACAVSQPTATSLAADARLAGSSSACQRVGLGSSGENSTYAQTDSPTLWSLDLWLDCEDPQLIPKHQHPAKAAPDHSATGRPDSVTSRPGRTARVKEVAAAGRSLARAHSTRSPNYERRRQAHPSQTFLYHPAPRRDPKPPGSFAPPATSRSR
ncbi:hypothetical protein L1887_56415 [Cichorium endivia]|nr:hypothetical protein L1887_56415 [Cichorium endivia]